MWRGAFLACCLIWSAAALSAEVADATGRSVIVPDQVRRVVPAGPPAAVLMAAIAPDLMAGWPAPVPDAARAVLPSDAAALPQIPRLTAREDASGRIAALHPDLILDYGDTGQRYIDLAIATQRQTGIPTLLLDGALDKVPAVLRLLGGVLHRPERADELARFTEALLSLPSPASHPTVVYARGPAGTLAAAPDTDVTAVFTRLGWTVLAPEGSGTFRPVTAGTVATLNPDLLVFSDPAMADALAHDPAWKAVRAVREGHAVVAPHLPFGWVEEPPSINRLIGFAWLSGHDPVTLAAMANAILYRRTLTPAERDTVLSGVSSIRP
ncbi:ABC transporter substrate-binding protein [Rhodopila sp.]|uniref:ABC transporter substrate-binding protein n=1 Tax=Rhodopila sp. TaxID=2480087 RepID=UPI002BFA302A|nr:ABC transporter substrate-binding protein [Rhodopila sp.]HVZ10673.1 ABC transporter substrate-binding protein [Rhodopila sp.]